MAKILIIEDSQQVQLCLSKMVQRMGHEVVTADDGERGLELAQQAAADVIISDLQLPGALEGVPLIRKLRDTRPNCPVVVVSGYPSEAMNKCYELGVNDFLVKPFEVSFLSQVIDRVLGGTVSQTAP